MVKGWSRSGWLLQVGCGASSGVSVLLFLGYLLLSLGLRWVFDAYVPPPVLFVCSLPCLAFGCVSYVVPCCLVTSLFFPLSIVPVLGVGVGGVRG